MMGRSEQAADPDPEVAVPAKPRLGRDFRLLWGAQSISLMGSSLLVVALPWEAFSLTHSTSGTAFVSAAQIAPYPILGVVSGVLADRFDRRRTMILTDVARSILALLLAVAIAFGVLRLRTLILATVLIGTFTATFDAAYAAATPQIVGADLLNAANGRLEASNAATGVIGPQVGGVLIAVGTSLAFGLDGMSYLVGALGSLLMRYRTPTPPLAGDAGLGAVGHMVKEGVAYLARSPVLGSLTAAAATLAISNGALDGLLVPLLRGSFHYSQLIVGAVFSAGAAGWLVASWLVAHARTTDRLSRCSLAAIGVAIIGGISVGLGHAPAVSAVAFFAFQGGIYYFLITVVTVRQRIVPADILGRVHALARALANVGTPVGAALGGILAGALPIGPTTAVLCSVPLAGSLGLAAAATWGRHREG
jgi:Transmembrane secretion effector